MDEGGGELELAHNFQVPYPSNHSLTKLTAILADFCCKNAPNSTLKG